MTMTRAMIAMAVLCLALAVPRLAPGRDLGQWGNSEATIREWYRNLMQPDQPHLSCCGEADAYEADEYERSPDGKNYIAEITDTRDDAPLSRRHIPPGTKIVVPSLKLKWDAGNPTGHGIIFISPTGVVLCYVAPSGT